MEHRQNVEGHGGDRIDVNLRVHKLQNHTRKEAGRPVVLHLEIRVGLPYFPGEIQHVCGAEHLHEKLHPGKSRVQRGTEHRARGHDDQKSRRDSHIEPDAPAKAQAGRVAHGQQVIGSRRIRRYKAVN